MEKKNPNTNKSIQSLAVHDINYFNVFEVGGAKY